MEKRHNVTITVSKLKFKQDPNSSATLITGRKNKTSWEAGMTRRQIRAFGQSPAYSNDSLEVRVDIEGDPKGMERTINPYLSGYSCCINNDDGTITYGTNGNFS